MRTAPEGHPGVKMDRKKLDRVRRILGAKTLTEALDQALDRVVSEARIDRALKKWKGKARIVKVFR